MKLTLFGVSIAILAAVGFPEAQRGAAPVQDMEHPQGTNAGIFAFTGRCASCHDTGKGGATDRNTLTRHTPEEVLASIANGSMANTHKGSPNTRSAWSRCMWVDGHSAPPPWATRRR